MQARRMSRTLARAAGTPGITHTASLRHAPPVSMPACLPACLPACPSSSSDQCGKHTALSSPPLLPPPRHRPNLPTSRPARAPKIRALTSSAHIKEERGRASLFIEVGQERKVRRRERSMLCPRRLPRRFHPPDAVKADLSVARFSTLPPLLFFSLFDRACYKMKMPQGTRRGSLTKPLTPLLSPRASRGERETCQREWRRRRALEGGYGCCRSCRYCPPDRG
jgi:hypothetical protein